MINFANMNSGYKGYSMSNRAAEAYDNGEKPMSKWCKSDILEELEYNFDDEQMKEWSKATAGMLKHYFLVYAAYHHTSSFCNNTNFYKIEIKDMYRELKPSKISEIVKLYKIKEKADREAAKKLKQEEKEEVPERWECKYLVWGGTRKHPKATEVTAQGEIKGNWFYPDGQYFKKSIFANGFEQIKQL